MMMMMINQFYLKCLLSPSSPKFAIAFGFIYCNNAIKRFSWRGHTEKLQNAVSMLAMPVCLSVCPFSYDSTPFKTIFISVQLGRLDYISQVLNFGSSRTKTT
jgi:hypothetical protein